MRVEFGEWLPDRADLENPCLIAENCIPSAGRYTQFQGLAAITGALPERPLGAISTSVITAQSETYVGTESTLQRLNGPSWTDVTPVGLAAASSWQFVQFGNNVFAASYENTLQFVQIGSGNDFADVTDGPKARCMATVRNFVFVGDIYDAVDGAVPWRVRWCAQDDPTDWPAAGTNAAFAALSDQQDLRAEDGAVKAIAGTEYALIFQEKAITRGTFVGSPAVFQFDRIDSTRGAISARSVVQVGGLCYFLSRDGFFVTDGVGESQSIGHGKVDRWLLDQLDDNTIQHIRGAADPRRKIIFWAVPTSGQSLPNLLIIFNYAEQRWSYANLDIAEIVYGRQPGFTLEQLDTYAASLDVLEIGLDDPFWGPGGTFLAGFTSDYKLASFQGDPLTATLVSGEFGLEGERGFVNGLRMLVTGQDTCRASIGHREKLFDDVTWTAEIGIGAATGRSDFRVSDFYFRAKVRIIGGFQSAHGVDALIVKDDAAR